VEWRLSDLEPGKRQLSLGSLESGLFEENIGYVIAYTCAYETVRRESGEMEREWSYV